MLRLMQGLPSNVLGISAEGEITGKDYETVLMPAVEEKLKSNKKIRMIYHLGGKFKGFDLSAMMDDAKVGMKHLTQWEKVALVSNHHMINAFARFFGYLLPGEVKVFTDEDFENAKSWISS